MPAMLNTIAAAESQVVVTSSPTIIAPDGRVPTCGPRRGGAGW